MPSLPAVIAFKRATLLSNYANVAGATLFIYDSLIMFPSEIEQRIYWFTGRQQSIVTNIYSIMKLVGALYFIALLYEHMFPEVTDAGCLVASVLTTLAVDVGYTSVIKAILALRLRAIYRYDCRVSIALYTLMLIEIIGALGTSIATAVLEIKYSTQIPLTFVGCRSKITEPQFMALYKNLTLVNCIIRFSTTAIEVILMLMKLSEEVNREKQRTDKSLWPAILQIRDLTPILYIFYRDGALASIPILVVDTLEVIARASPSSAVGGINWNMWLLLTYQVCGSRLILNVRRANRGVTSSMIPECLSTLRFTPCDSTSSDSEYGISMTVYTGILGSKF